MRRYPRVFGSPAAKAQSRAAVCAPVIETPEEEGALASVADTSGSAPAKSAAIQTAGD